MDQPEEYRVILIVTTKVVANNTREAVENIPPHYEYTEILEVYPERHADLFA